MPFELLPASVLFRAVIFPKSLCYGSDTKCLATISRQGAERQAGGEAKPRSGAARTTGPRDEPIPIQGRMPKVCEKHSTTQRSRGVRAPFSHTSGMRPWGRTPCARDPVVLTRQASLHHRLPSVLPLGAGSVSVAGQWYKMPSNFFIFSWFVHLGCLLVLPKSEESLICGKFLWQVSGFLQCTSYSR